MHIYLYIYTPIKHIYTAIYSNTFKSNYSTQICSLSVWHSTDFNRITESVQDKLSMFKVCSVWSRSLFGSQFDSLLFPVPCTVL